MLLLIHQLLVLPYRLFKKAEDPLYRGLGLGLFVAVCSCLAANCFGDRWTYLEINGLLWVLAGATVRASALVKAEAKDDVAEAGAAFGPVAYTAYR